MTLNNKLAFGDYQTPKDFCDKVVDLINDKYTPNYVFEPTFGLGHFLTSSIKGFNNVKGFYGNEINIKYFSDFKDKTKNSNNITLYNENIFLFNHSSIINTIERDRILIIGNPPWVTNSQLASNELDNLPQKSNFKKMKGFDSITGASNFDICEYIMLDLLKNYRNTNFMIAMLCKTSVATNIIKNINDYDFNLKNISLYLFDAKKVFNVGCEACLFVAESSDISENTAKVYNIDDYNNLLYEFGWKNGKYLSKFTDLELNIDGKFYTEWRQGIKHDCSKVMELKIDNNNLINKLNELVEIESEYVYPLLKSSDLKENIIDSSSKQVIVTQKYVREDTNHIMNDAPKTWSYLTNHKDLFDNRKSIIYKNCPPFSIFGIGNYSFAKYKVAISGFYKNPNFILTTSERPMMLDDTCYFIGFDNINDAFITMVLLNSNIVSEFLYSIAFLDKKRPYTKDILMRIDFNKLLNNTTYEDYVILSSKYNYDIEISKTYFDDYKKRFEEKD